MTPAVSIVTPVHNGAVFILETIASVQAQTWEDWELLVVDDASEDESAEIVEGLAAEDSRIRLFRLERNGGAAVARNAAIQAAQGRYIAFLDSDDWWVPQKLEKQIRFMGEAQCGFSFTGLQRVDEAGGEIALFGVPGRVSYRELLKTNYIGCSTVMYDSAAFGKVEMPLIRKRQDYGLWLRLLKRTDYACGINEALTRYRVRSGSVSSNKATTSLFTWRVYREVEGLSLLRSTYCLAHQTGRALIRNRFPGLARRLGWLHEVGAPG